MALATMSALFDCCAQYIRDTDALLKHLGKAHVEDVAVFKFGQDLGSTGWTVRNTNTGKFYCPLGGCVSSKRAEGILKKKHLVHHIKKAHTNQANNDQPAVQNAPIHSALPKRQSTRANTAPITNIENADVETEDRDLHQELNKKERRRVPITNIVNTDVGMEDEDSHQDSDARAEEEQCDRAGPSTPRAKIPLVQIPSNELYHNDLIKLDSFNPFGVVLYPQPISALLCETCKCFLPRESIIQHAFVTHNLCPSNKQIQSFTDACNAHGIPKYAYQYTLPENKSKPLPYTFIIDNGLACKHCQLRMCSKKTMEEHVRKEHKDEYLKYGIKACYLSNIPIQRLFRKEEYTISRYFEVNRLKAGKELTLTDPAQNDILQSIIHELLPQVPELSHQGSTDDRELSAFQAVFQWQHLLRDILADTSGKQLKLVGELNNILGHKKTSEMDRLRHGLQAYMRSGTRIYKGFERGDLVGGHVLNGKYYRSAAKLSMFKPTSLDATLTDYGNVVFSFVSLMLAFINQIYVVKQIQFSLPFSDRQRQLGEELYKQLKDEDHSTESNFIHLHEFVISIFDTPTTEAPGQHSLFLAVLALRAVNVDGSFIPPERVTPELARLHYLCNVAILVEGERNEEQQGDFFTAVDVAHEIFYDDSKSNFLGDLMYKQKFACKWVQTSPKAAQLTWDTDANWVAYEGRKVVLDDLRNGLKALIERCWDIIRRMVGEYNFLADLPTKFEDNHGKKEMNHGFFKGLPETAAKFFQLVTKHTQMALSVRKGRKAAWHKDNANQLLRWIGELNDNIAILTYWTGAITIRGTELMQMQMQVRNAVESRNVFVNDTMDGPELFLMQYYSKTSMRFSREDLRLHIPAQQVQELLLVFIYCIRPAEAAMVWGVYGNEERNITEKYLFVSQGRRTTSERFSSLLRDFMITYCKADIGLRGCRQIAVSISHKFMVVGFIYVDNTDDHVDIFAGHSASIARQSYDQVKNALKQETQSRRDRFMSREWWCILGLTDKPPPKPRLTSYESTLLDADTLGDARMQRQLDDVMKMVQANNTMLTKLMSVISDSRHQLTRPYIPSPTWKSAEPNADSPPPETFDVFNHFADADGDATVTLALLQDSFSTSLASAKSSTPSKTPGESPRPSHSRSRSKYRSGGRSRDVVATPKRQRPLSIVSQHRPHLPPAQSSPRTSAVRVQDGYESPSTPCLPSLASLYIDGVTPESMRRARSRSIISQRPLPDSELSTPTTNPVNADNLSRPPSSISPSTPTRTIKFPSVSRHDDPSQSTLQVTSTTSEQEKAIIRLQLQKLYDNPIAREKSVEQMDAIADILRADGDLIVVLPTGGGKSAMWNVIATLRPRETILVVCPFRAILDQQLAISRSLGIQAAHFQMSHKTDLSNPDYHASILFCVPESYSKKSAVEEFELTTTGLQISRMIIDEAHALFIDPLDDRKKETIDPFVMATRASRYPKVYLTATLAPKHVAAFMTNAGLETGTRIIRTQTDRPNLATYVLKPTIGDNLSARDMLNNLIGQVKRHIERLAEDGIAELAMIYVPDVGRAKEIASRFDIPLYHARLTVKEKSLSLKKWQSNHPTIVATSALGTGIDYPNIRYVILDGAVHGLYNFVQSIGRAGRDYEESFIVTVYKDSEARKAAEAQSQSQDYIHLTIKEDIRADMQKYLDLQESCRRAFITSIMDGAPGVSCSKFTRLACEQCEPLGENYQMICDWARTSTLEPEHLPMWQPKLLALVSTDGIPLENVAVSKDALKHCREHSQSEHSGEYDPPGHLPKRIRGNDGGILIPSPSEVPVSRSTVASRQKLAKSEEQMLSNRLDMVHTLLIRLHNCCIYCMVLDRTLFQHGYSNSHCSLQSRARIPHLKSFKAWFQHEDHQWERYSACFACGCVQDRDGNAQFIGVHQAAGYDADDCEWVDLMYLVVWIFWNVPLYRAEMLNACGLPRHCDLEQFCQYLLKSDNIHGRLSGLVETFVWCCRNVMPTLLERIIPNTKSSKDQASLENILAGRM